MNYCADFPTALSDKEKLFAQMTYPNGSKTPIRALYGFETSSGLLARTNSAFRTDWTARGALGAAYKSPPAWISAGRALTPALTLNASQVPRGSSSLSGTFKDYRNVTRTLETTTVRVDDSTHTALLTAIL